MRRSKFEREIRKISDGMEKAKLHNSNFNHFSLNLPLKKEKAIEHRKNNAFPTFIDKITENDGNIIATVIDDGSYSISERFNRIPENFRKPLLNLIDQYSLTSAEERCEDGDTLAKITSDSGKFLFLQQEIDALKEKVRELSDPE